jgi:hypothetical protein
MRCADRPSAEEVAAAVRPRKANGFRFYDDGIIPNNPDLALILYRSPVRLWGDFDPAVLIEDLFQSNGWTNYTALQNAAPPVAWASRSQH